MSKIEENLSEIFDVETNKIEKVSEGELIPVETNTHSEDDFNIVRTNINSLIEKGNTAIDDLLKVAKESEHPRAYEVAANMLKTLSDLNKDLIDIQKKKKEIQGPSNTSNDKPLIDKAVFVGSTTDLVKLIRSNK